MKKLVFAGALAALIALPALSQAQVGGICNFEGSATLTPPLGSTPTTGGKYTFSGKTSGAACGKLVGTVSSPDGKFTGPAACEGNIHSGTATTALGKVTYYGVCAGPDCSGAGYSQTPPMLFQYNLIFDQDTLTRATTGGECEAGTFSKASFDGTAAGGKQ